MVERVNITAYMSVSPQLAPGDLASLAAAGVRTLINNRPDNEEEAQTSSARMEQAARDHGLHYVHLPVVSGQITDDDVAAFRRVMDEVPGPVHAYCRSGMRSICLWALSGVHGLDADAVIATAAGAGFDLSGIRERLGQTGPGTEI